MSISEKKIIPLSIEKCEAFKPRKEKEKDTLKNQNLQLNLNLIEEDEKLPMLKDIPRRKSSTGSTSASRIEDVSDIPSFPNTPSFCSQESQQSGIFFGRDRNCTNNPLFNFYQNTEDILRETYPEFENYKKTRNYKLKSEFYKITETSENKVTENTNVSNNIDNNSTQNNNNYFNNSLPTTSVAAVMGAFTPKICSGGKGKFDLPMYYVGFYGWAPKDFNHKNEKCEKSDTNSSSGSGDDSSQKDKKSDNNQKMQEIMEPTMMIGTPIFFSSMPKYCYNKLYKRKQKPFTEREGDWICNSCKNLNFAFRVECNRCKLPKGADAKTNNNDDKNKENNQEQKPYQRNQRYNKHKKNYNYYYNNKNNGNENGKE